MVGDPMKTLTPEYSMAIYYRERLVQLEREIAAAKNIIKLKNAELDKLKQCLRTNNDSMK